MEVSLEGVSLACWPPRVSFLPNSKMHRGTQGQQLSTVSPDSGHNMGTLTKDTGRADGARPCDAAPGGGGGEPDRQHCSETLMLAGVERDSRGLSSSQKLCYWKVKAPTGSLFLARTDRR